MDSEPTDNGQSGGKKAVFVFGPYLGRWHESRTLDQNIEDTGCFLEFATPQEGPRLAIFRCTEFKDLGPRFADYVIREEDLPFDIMVHGIHVKHLAGGPYIRLSAFLAGMSRHFDRLRPIEDFLGDFCEMLPVETLSKPNPPEYPLKSFAASAGYRVLSVFPYGRRLCVDIAWLAPNTTSLARVSFLTIGGIDFRPRPDRTLGSGKWQVRWEHVIEYLLFDKLRRLVGNDLSLLFEDTAKSKMLELFQWTPLALMTSQEARQARIEFVKSHPDLVNDSKTLAQAMIDAGLYSSETSTCQICKFLPSLVSAACGDNKMIHVSPRRKFTEIYQLKVELGVRPRVWRRIHIPASFTFWELHSAIQDAMGWEDIHLHEFTCDFDPATNKEARIAIPDEAFGTDKVLDEFTSKFGNEFEEQIARWFTAERKIIYYRYDFGDNWTHRITVEKVMPAADGVDYPRCVEGARACPPENCGGESGYECVCRSRKNPSTGTRFVPNSFDPAAIVFEDPRKRKRRVLS